MKILLFFFLSWAMLSSCTDVKQSELELNAANYGLEEGKDGTQAIIAAIADAKAKSATRLIIPKGKYSFSNKRALEKYIAISNNDNSMKRMLFAIIGFNNFVIDGQGSEFIFDGEMVPFVIENSKNITIKGISIDWKGSFLGQAKVIEVNKKTRTFDVKVNQEYQVHKGTLWFKMIQGFNNTGKNLWFYPDKGGTVYNVNKYKLDPWNPWHSDSYQATDLGDGVVRIQTKTDMDIPEVGWNWVCKGTSDLADRQSPAFRLYRSFNINLIDINMHHSGAMGLIGEKSGNVTIDNMHVEASGNRAVSTAADATHFVNCKGTITVKNSYFAHMLDDAINVHGIYVKITEVKDEYTLAVNQIHNEQHGFDFAEAGDSIIIADNKTLMPVDTFVVKEYNWFNAEYQEIVVDKPIGKHVKVNFGIENITWTAGLNFVNNTVEKNRARGIIFSTRKPVLIEGNKFSNMMAAISISGDNNYWFESGPSTEITIKNNKFVNCDLGGKANAVILIAPIITHPKLTKDYYNGKISITGNTITAFDKSILFALSVNELEFKNNKLIHDNSFNPIFPNKPTFEINSVGKFTLEGNEFNEFNNGDILIDSASAKGMNIENNQHLTGDVEVKGEAQGLNKIL